MKMSSDLKREDILMKVRSKLLQDSIKLWLQPYITEDSRSNEEEIKNLALSYSEDLKVDLPTAISALKDLQANAIDKISARKKFQKTGVATVKVRISANRRDAVVLQSIEIPLSEKGIKLKEILAEKLGTSCDRLKLISNGHVINEDMQLCSQSIQNGMQIMALHLDEFQSNLEASEKRQNHLNSVKADAQLLASRKNDENVSYLQVADQSGKLLQLPKEEEQALSVAMTFHEKGRAALKSEDYALALVFFLEADNEFSQCNSNLLKAVDNYALLNLDIAWCYLCLKSVAHLPDAERRLKTCEDSFHNSYGANLERLQVLKGSTGNERALFFRLHVLQAIVSYHQGKRDIAVCLIEKADKEYSLLKVDDASLCQMIELGYTAAEARLALRAVHGDTNLAMEMIEQKRKEHKELRQKEQMERTLGRCKDGRQWVNIHAYQRLLSMGFQSDLAAASLRVSNNATPLAVEMLQDHMDELEKEVERFGLTKVSKKSSINKLTDMGFDLHMVKIALKKCKWNVEKAIEFITHGRDFDADSESSSSSEGSRLSAVESAKRRKEEEAAYGRLSEGISSHEEDHLDLTLEQEAEFLRQYKELLTQKANTSVSG